MANLAGFTGAPWSAREPRRASEVFDLRASAASPPGQWLGDVSLQDVLGARLVTYDRELQPPAGGSLDAPLQPKAVYVQYLDVDPVTQMQAPVVVPAQMSLEVFADPNFDWFPQANDEVVDDDGPPEEDVDRRKLKSSIRGDPILLRAKPAQVPDPYYAPLRQEIMAASSPSAGPRLGGASRGHSAQDAGTMSSFLKASGKDKYARSRLGELDRILSRARDQTLAPEAALDGSAGGPANKGSRGLTGAAPVAADLTAQLAYHIRHVPKLDNLAANRGVQGLGARAGGEGEGPKAEGAAAATVGSDAGEEEDIRGSATSLVGATVTSGTVGTVRRRESAKRQTTRESIAVRSSRISKVGRASLARPSAARVSVAATTLADSSITSSGTFSSFSSGQGSRELASRTSPPSTKLRDLDPHLAGDGPLPTQRLHGNWPDGLRRQLARDFYGMTPRQILKEELLELKERAEASRPRSSPREAEGAAAGELSDGGGEALPSQSSQNSRLDPLRSGSPERLALERRIQRSTACSGKVPYRLEIRVKNTERSSRVVVARDLGGTDQAARRTVLLDTLRSQPRHMNITW